MRWARRELIGLAAMIAPLPAAASVHPFFRPQHPIEAPYGFTAMCRASPDTCRDDRVHVAIAPQDWERLLRRINRQVNRHVRQISDTVRFARKDVWQASGIARGAAGDCEDIALEKRKLLLDAGIPANRLFLAIAYGRGSVGLHLVLIARTVDADVVLDSRSATITPWSNAPYTWIAIQSADQPGLCSACDHHR